MPKLNFDPLPRAGSTIARAMPWLAFLALAACDAPPANAAAEDVADRLPLVRVVPVETRSIRREIETTAYLESEHRVSVLSMVSGRVTEVMVDEGDRVQKGQVLARLDDREVAAARTAFEVQLEDRRVRAKLAELEATAAGRRVEKARIERSRTEAEFARLSAQDPDSVARRDLEEAEFARDSAIESFSVSEYDKQKAELDHKAALNSIDEAVARLEEADTRLSDHQIVAPLSGTVVERKITGGETIGSTTALFDVVNLDSLVTYLSRPQLQLPLVQNAKEIIFVADAYPDREFIADIDLVSSVVDQETGHFKIRARVRAEDVAALRPGMFIRARILTEEKRDALMVPKSALLADGDQSIAFAVRDGIAFKITIDPGLEEQTFIECGNRGDGGLRPDDVVIVAGHADLKDQSRVELSDL